MPNAPELARGRSAPFVATDGTAYLYWKNDGNAVGKDTWISVQRLSADGLRLEGEPKRLLRQDLPWEGRLVEAAFARGRDAASTSSTRPTTTAATRTRWDTPPRRRRPDRSRRTPNRS